MFKKEKYEIDDLLELMAFLRSENGCPWDREQTHDSIKHNVIEEAYEVVDAISSNDSGMLSDELGDLLLQVVFHSQMAKEANEFDFDDVVRNICEKLISRHTHLFGENKDSVKSSEDVTPLVTPEDYVSPKSPEEGVARISTEDAISRLSAEDVISLWEKNKKKEKNQGSQAQSMKEIARALPALMRAYKIQKKAAQSGFDWDNIDDVTMKIHEELDEIKDAMKTSNVHERTGKVEMELGDLLFSVVNYARFLGVDPEVALDKSSNKFIRRFERVEQEFIDRKIDMKSTPLAELDEVWDWIKAEDHN
jgi:tetrapyrrole methylase family protein/MazG family protein